MTAKTGLALALALLTSAIRLGPAAAAGAAVSAKQFPNGYFYRFQQVPLAEKEKVLASFPPPCKGSTGKASA